MPFDPEKCALPTVYCGKQERKYPYYENDNLYVRKGTSEECLKKGFGAASIIAAKKNIPEYSLQKIRYVGPVFEKRFQEEGIYDLKQFRKYVEDHSVKQIDQLLGRVFQNSNKTLNMRGYNSALLYLYRNGNSRLPSCQKIDFE